MERIGIIESVDIKNKIVKFAGYGDYIGDYPKESNEFPGMIINTTKIKMDTGDTIWITDLKELNFYSSEEKIKELLNKYRSKGYKIT